MTLYEFNKAGYASLPAMDDEAIDKAIKNIIEPYITKTNGRYYMLLNNDKHYYTIFAATETGSSASLSDALISLVQSDLGAIKSIEMDASDMAIEIWVAFESSCEMYAFFDYTEGVIELP